MLEKGATAPDLTLPSHTRERVSLAERWRERPLVLLFIPLAFTSTCTEELCTVSGDLAAYTGLDAEVVALSVDSPWVLERYRDELGADFLFLSDFNREATRAFGVLREAPVGPGLRGVADRSVFVIGRDGVVRYAWRSENPSLLPPFDEIKAALAETRAAAA